METKKIAAVAEMYYVPIAPHNPNSPLSTLATAHVVANVPNFLIMELLNERVDAPWRDEVISEPFLSPHFAHLPPDVHRAGSVWLEAAVDGSVLSDRGHRINRFLRRLRVEIASGGLVRKLAYGHPYWVRKPEEAADAQR